MKEKKIKILKILIIIMIIVSVTLAVVLVVLNNDSKEAEVDKEAIPKSISYENDDIIKYEVQTSEYFQDKPDTNKYYINSEDELSIFYSIYSDELNIDTNYLKNNAIFIETLEERSGGIQNKLESVTFDNNKVNFIIKTKGLGETDDMAFWYFVAIIPNGRLSGIDISDWSKPSEILKTIDINNWNKETWSYPKNK